MSPNISTLGVHCIDTDDRQSNKRWVCSTVCWQWSAEENGVRFYTLCENETVELLPQNMGKNRPTIPLDGWQLLFEKYLLEETSFHFPNRKIFEDRNFKIIDRIKHVLKWKIFGIINKTITGFDFSMIWKVVQIGEGVINLGLLKENIMDWRHLFIFSLLQNSLRFPIK